MKRFLVSALFAGLSTTAQAAVTANDLVSAYQAQGYTAIEVVTGATQVKVEAVKNGTKVEVIYDIASGAILAQEQKRARPRDANDTSVEIGTSPGDFTTGMGDDSDDDGDDRGRGRGRGSDDGADHDSDDDHGGDRDDNDDDDDHDDDHGGSHGHGGGDDDDSDDDSDDSSDD